MVIIGLTGGIGTGKSTVAKILRELGAKILDADQVARKIVEPGQPALNEIVKHFGKKVLTSKGELNRPYLAQLIFNDPEKREVLNQITHPAIGDYLVKKIERLKKAEPNSVIVLEIPLLIEAGMEQMVDKIWITEVDEKLQLERVMKRDGLTYEDAVRRIESQISSEERKSYGDAIFDTGKNLEELKEDIIREWNLLFQQKSDF